MKHDSKTTGNLDPDEIDEDILTYEAPDEALEATASLGGAGRSLGYCSVCTQTCC